VLAVSPSQERATDFEGTGKDKIAQANLATRCKREIQNY